MQTEKVMGMDRMLDHQSTARATITLGRISVEPYQSMRDLVSAVFPAPGVVQPGFGIAINAEKVIASLEDDELVACARSATIRFADGIGVVWALRRRGHRVPRLAGVEFWAELMRNAATQQAGVFLIGGARGVAEDVADRLRTQHPFICIRGTRHGFLSELDETELIDDLAKTQPDIVTVAMGSPRQERLIAKLRAARPNSFYLGVGGTYDVFTGRVARAPRFFRENGLEWFYRLMKQPTRARRQTALLRFAALEIRGRL
jgi:UDP-N-acetyl-D-mannosaminouronate:lipid I N-acetyl-D-mannosaminouronosyltransferase